MKIGIVGAGRIGATAARLFVRAGHEVAISNSRGPKSLQSLVEELGPRAYATTVNDAASFGDIVLLAFPWRIKEAMPNPNLLREKIVIDAMNPYTASARAGVAPVSSRMMGTAFEMNRMPAVTFRKSMNQSSQNCGVRIASDGG